ncbi:uncharacterized protein LOC129766608 [Toxorhynchites rutilus septentrionalis]|uniref:uncharacterized protein LOC129766608 n=1 Tax=Toxorhynchites rutilus septentrionalis TaxID=329112 RepID=UPI00247A83D5|nr:uncharacterized protein LOC129766608 [Toxorhynchites rutilus septentrionalis]
MVADLTTAAFIAAFKRFVARRGKPAVVFCDNATNFVGARRELDELRKLFVSQQTQQSLASTAADSGIEFRFIPARSPNFGGLWEAAVKSMKQHLKKTIGINIVTPDELHTVLAQIEACLNSRPLTPVSNDPSDLDVLTPGHFLIQRSLMAVPEPMAEDVQEHQLSRWRRAQLIVHRIWSKWSTEYLANLQNRTKWTRHWKNLAVGMMVLIKEDNLPWSHHAGSPRCGRQCSGCHSEDQGQYLHQSHFKDLHSTHRGQRRSITQQQIVSPSGGAESTCGNQLVPAYQLSRYYLLNDQKTHGMFHPP